MVIMWATISDVLRKSGIWSDSDHHIPAIVIREGFVMKDTMDSKSGE